MAPDAVSVGSVVLSGVATVYKRNCVDPIVIHHLVKKVEVDGLVCLGEGILDDFVELVGSTVVSRGMEMG